MWMLLPPQRPVVTLTVDLYNLIRSSVGADKYSLSVSSRLLRPFMRYRGNKTCPDKQTNAADEQSENITMSGGERIKKPYQQARNIIAVTAVQYIQDIYLFDAVKYWQSKVL